MNREINPPSHRFSRMPRIIVAAALSVMLCGFYAYNISHQRISGLNNLDFSQCTIEMEMLSAEKVVSYKITESTLFKGLLSSISDLSYWKSHHTGPLACGSDQLFVNIDVDDGRQYQIIICELRVDIWYSKGDHQIRYIANSSESSHEIYQSALRLYHDVQNSSAGTRS